MSGRLWSLVIWTGLLTTCSFATNSTSPSRTSQVIHVGLKRTSEEVTTSSSGPRTTTTRENPNSEDASRTESASVEERVAWECPNITGVGIECSCDFPHTLRCAGERSALQAISAHLGHSKAGMMISLLDLSVSGISTLPANFLEDVALHGLVVSSGELRRVDEAAFTSFARPLQALGLPNNLLDVVPTAALSKLAGLERLDFSHNKLKTLEASSFQGLPSITYLDLSYNLLAQLSPRAFASLPALRSLKMRGNRLSASALSALRGLRSLEELDLSANLLSGPLGPGFLPLMPRLRYLNVAENELKNVQQGALMGLKNLSSLSLSHNQIDVLEDHAFRYSQTLTHLELAYNDIVAVSSSSLAHLENLLSLDLSHNFLRSLSADLIVPLRSLEELRLDDNDISMVTSDLPTPKLKLRSISLADNPLSCDCSLLEFAGWLAASNLTEEDKRSAVCATPPALENGLLVEVPAGSLLCGEPPSPAGLPGFPPSRLSSLSSAQLSLAEFHYDEATGVDLLWRVQPCSERYTCDSLLVYESSGGGSEEVQIASSPIHCDSRLMREPCSLPVSLPPSLVLQNGHRYRYCVVLMLPSGYDEVSGHGCSDLIQLEDSLHLVARDSQPADPPLVGHLDEPQISALHVNLSSDGLLKVEVRMSAALSRAHCEIEIDIFAVQSGQVHRKRVNCSAGASTSLSGLLPARYRVCARLVDEEQDEQEKRPEQKSPEGKARCVEVQTFQQRQARENLLLFLLLLLAVLGLSALVFFALGRSLLRKAKQQPLPPQCFMPAQQLDITHKAHYIKLLATTKV